MGVHDFLRTCQNCKHSPNQVECELGGWTPIFIGKGPYAIAECDKFEWRVRNERREN